MESRRAFRNRLIESDKSACVTQLFSTIGGASDIDVGRSGTLGGQMVDELVASLVDNGGQKPAKIEH